MSTQLLRGSNKDDLFDADAKPASTALPPQVFDFVDVVEHIEEALVEKRISHNQAYRFKVIESIFAFFETRRSELFEAASQDFNGKAARVELELDYAFTLSQIAAALQTQCAPHAPSGALPDRFFKKLTTEASGTGDAGARVDVARPVGAVLIVAQPKRPFDDLFAPLVSAVAAGNVVCAVLSPTLPNVNKVILEQLTPAMPKSAVFFVNPADMVEAQQGVADLRTSPSEVFGIQLPGSTHVATRITVPGSAYVSASLLTPSSAIPFGLGGPSAKAVAAKLKDIATEVVEGAAMCLGRGVGSPKYLFVNEEVYAGFRDALLLAIATSSANLAPRDDGSKLEELILGEQSAGSKVGVSGGAARLQKPFPSEKRPGSVALVEVDVEASRAAKLSAVISDRKAVALIKELAALVLVGVSSTEHAFGIVEELGLNKGNMVVYSNDSAEVQHVLRELEAATLSVNHVAPENLFSSYAPRSHSSSAVLHHHRHARAPRSENAGLRWPLELFQTSSTAYLPAVRSTSLGLSGIAASSAASRSALSSMSTNQRQLAVKKALASHLAKTKRMANRSRPAVAVPVLRVFFLQGLFLFWGSALTCTLAGLSFGAFKLSHWAWMRYVSSSV
ncbi:conserved hypothetical protein [Sporisorium reilianum SRZ2]|uniref:Aldehyde dehydrogenase domain-containing protein n=1 Tax=Sporisorium reilianum (strain SRZ2) TaxID=999809 RepID=E7A3C3_SPORE|nr:conserved hypothetical protein [Sporisorium reilianum SRZ2]